MKLEQLQVLVVEDDYLVAEEIKRTLRKLGHMIIGEGMDGKEAIELDRKLYPDIIIMDINMPDIDGIEASRRILEGRDVPIIILTAFESQDFVVRASEAGVNSYLVKPPRENELQRAITLAMARHRDLVKIKKEKNMLTDKLKTKMDEAEKNKALAMMDPLTQTYNRRYFFDTVECHFSCARELNKNISISLIDIDDFKKINDTYGHLAGDYILKEFAGILKQSWQEKMHILARYGGEEFIIMFFDQNKEESFILIDKLRELIQKTTFTYDNRNIPVRFSGGVSDLKEDWEATITVEEITKRADERLYKAKRRGKNRIEYL